MATKSVFTFKIENEKNKDKIDKTIKEFLNARAFEYNYEKKIYVRMPGKINKTAYAVTAAAGAVLGQGVYIQSFPFGFEYEIIENQLIIKAYLVSKDLKRSKYIHSKLNNTQVANNYYNDLKGNLFPELEKYSELNSTETEKIKDKTENIIKIISIIIAIFCLLILILALNS